MSHIIQQGGYIAGLVIVGLFFAGYYLSIVTVMLVMAGAYKIWPDIKPVKKPERWA